MPRNKISPEEKLNSVRRFMAGKESQTQIAQRLNVNLSSVQQWISKYKSEGTAAFFFQGNKHYPKELKEQAVLEYLNGNDSQQQICQKYGIRAKVQLQRWIEKYNSHEPLLSSGTGGKRIMTKGRKTTFKERVEIVQYCIAHRHNYTDTAAQFQVSYQQARNYTLKYEAHGVEGLRDHRGRKKTEEEMTELDKLRAENKILRAEKEYAEMEASFLKKLEKIERRRG